MRIAVLGATGTIGRLVVERALADGHEVTALVRSPEKLGALAAQVRVVQGDVLRGEAVSRAVAGQDAILYAVGAGNVRATTLFSESTTVLVGAMQQHRVRRLVCLTGVGAGETKGHGGFVYDRILYPLFTRGIYADKDRQEEIIRRSDVDWTLVRAAPFRSRTPAGPLVVATDVDGVTLRRIGTAEVAAFMVAEAAQNRYVRRAVFIGHA